MTHVSSNLPPLLGSSVSCPLVVNTRKYFVIPTFSRGDSLVLVLQVHLIVVAGWMSQSDEMVKDHKSCEDFSVCLWPPDYGSQQNWKLVCQNTNGILLYTSDAGDLNFISWCSMFLMEKGFIRRLLILKALSLTM